MKIVCWWSGGVTSAVACKKAIEIYGVQNCRVVFIDTNNEHEDTYRFKSDCEKWYLLPIETIKSKDFNTVQEVWEKHLSMNVATGAICSTIMKQKVRKDWQKTQEYDHQVFGFEFEKKEFNRALSMAKNHPETKPVFPLLMLGLSKKDCLEIVEQAGLLIPEMYRLGFTNNNCFKTGCVQGGIGYWQKMARDFPEKFEAMAAMEHKLTDKSGFPVTMLKDQSDEAKENKKADKYANLVFLKPHPNYPSHKSIADMKGREVESLIDCNGFCGLDDLQEKKKDIEQLNMDI